MSSREKFNERRRHWYRTKKGYREKQRRWSRDYACRQREVLSKEPKERGSTKRPFTIVLIVEGRELFYTCWSVGVLEDTLEVRRGYIASKELRGDLPATPLRRTAKRFRYYTTEMMDGVADSVAEHGWVGSGLHALVIASWKDIKGFRMIERGQFKDAFFRTSFALHPGGSEVDLFGIDYLAYCVGRSEKQVWHWISLGFIPKTPFMLGSDPLFTRGMVQAVVDTVSSGANVRFELSNSAYSEAIEAAWKKQLGELYE